MPLLREGTPIGVIIIFKTEVAPFTDKQIELVNTFADQAVIAIENTRLLKELQDRNDQLTESLEQQTATSEILRVIASSPTDVQPVLDVVAENAAKLCEATDASILQVEGDDLRLAASFGSFAPLADHRPLNRETPSGRAILDRETIHIRDLLDHLDEFPPQARTRGLQGGLRTLLATPLYRERVPIGAIIIRRTEVRPFSEKQIALLQTFADQAVIAIENVRLFKELQERNSELREALEHQTATAEVLGIISRSPTDIQPVLNTVAETAARLCEAIDVMVLRAEGDILRLVAHHGPIPAGDVALHRGTLGGRTVIERRVFHITDLQAEVDEFPEGSALARDRGHRTTLSVPLLRENVAIGNIQVRRDEVRPFSDQQIGLLQTFADQAVIAIENVRLFNELKESLEQQTAMSEILGVIASSPTDVQPVLDVVAENAARLCDASNVGIWRTDGANCWPVVFHGPVPVPRVGPVPMVRESNVARAMIDREIIHIPDMLSPQAQVEFPVSSATAQRLGVRTALIAPLLREGVAIGAIHLRRTDVRPFSDKQIALLKTFADQSVIAIENVRLFQELNRVAGAANGDERNLRRDRQLADRHSARVGYHRGERCAGVQCE